MVLNNAGGYWDYSSNTCECSSVVLNDIFKADIAGTMSDLSAKCSSYQDRYCEGKSPNNIAGNKYDIYDYYRYGSGDKYVRYNYYDGKWFVHAYHGCSPIEMLYACVEGTT
jgi:hypothetical protein